MFFKKLDLAALNTENILFQIDTGLMYLQKIKSKHQVKVTVLFPSAEHIMPEIAKCQMKDSVQRGSRTSITVSEAGT